MNEIKHYQPWSAPVLHAKLSTVVLEELIELTDIIVEDVEGKQSSGSLLAGELEREWLIDPILLVNIRLKEYINVLVQKYKDIMCLLI